MGLISSTQPSLRARLLAKFPAQVRAGSGISIVKAGGTYTFSTDVSSTSGNGQFLYNNGGAIAGNPNVVYNGDAIVVGGGVSFPNLFGGIAGLQINRGVSDGNRGSISIASWNDFAFGPGISFSHSRNFTFGGHKIVQDGDELGYLYFGGSDGNTFRTSAGIRVACDGAASVGNVPGYLSLMTGGTVERLRIDSNGFVIISNAGSGNLNSGKLQVNGTSFNDASIRVMGFSTAANEFFIRSNGVTLGSQVPVANGDALGQLFFHGSDGTSTQEAARIEVVCDGTPVAGTSMPGRLKLETTPVGAIAAIERLRIENNGQITVQPTIAVSAGGTPNVVRLLFGSGAGFGIYAGSGVPTVTAGQGSLYLRTDGSTNITRAYINTTGSNVWTPINTVA